MGMSTHIVGVKPPDEKWKRMKKVWDACKAADISIPDEVVEFFNNEEPDDKGIVIDFGSSYSGQKTNPCVRKWSEDTSSGFEVDLKLVPHDVTIIRFYNSW